MIIKTILFSYGPKKGYTIGWVTEWLKSEAKNEELWMLWGSFIFSVRLYDKCVLHKFFQS